MVLSFFKFNWKNSPAHLQFLTEFLNPNAEKDFLNSDRWKSVLKEDPRKAIKRFLDEGVIEETSIAGILEYKYKSVELKSKLKQLGLKVSGKKNELVERLLSADLENLKRETQGMYVFQCTEQGKEIAEQYKVKQKERREKFEERTFQALQQQEFITAGRIVAEYEGGKVFPSIIYSDWKNYDSKRDVKILETMFYKQPKILKSLTEDQMKYLRIAAGMMFLWRYNNISKWLPNDFETELILDNNSAARMIYVFALHKENMTQYKREKVKKVEISPVPNACPECKKLANITYKLNQVPELPYEKCTNEAGCMCITVPHYY